MAIAQIPVLDLSGYTSGCNEDDRSTAAQQWADACRGAGFLAVQLPLGDVSRELLTRAFAGARELFAMPLEAKLALRRLTPEENCGYSPLSSEALEQGKVDCKEAFNVRKRGVHKNDYTGAPDSFVAGAEALWDALEAAALRVAECAADALGIERDFFARTLGRWDEVTLRFLHYPPCTWSEDDDQLIRCGAHTDFGLFTLLFVLEGEDGLQLKPIEGAEVSAAAAGPWLTAKLPADGSCCVVNTGALMARWTNDVFRATAHRVIVPSAEAAQRHRYSIAFFVDPDAAAEVRAHPSLVPPGEEPKYPPTTGHEYLLAKLREAHGPR